MQELVNLNIEELVKTTFPFAEYYRVFHSFYLKKGLADWETWFVIIHRGDVFNDYMLLTICGHSSYTRVKFLHLDFTLENFLNEFNKAETPFLFYKCNKIIDEEYFMTVNDMNRLHSYLKSNNIELFEPTQ